MLVLPTIRQFYQEACQNYTLSQSLKLSVHKRIKFKKNKDQGSELTTKIERVATPYW